MALVLAVGGCRCGDEPGLGGTREGFRPQEDTVDFGRVLEGEQARRQVTLLATARGSITVTAAAAAPFSVATPEVTVPGSGTATVEVVFTAGNGEAEGTLLLEGRGDTEFVRLTGTGVRPKPCPVPQCRQARFDVESGECIESPQEDGAACIPESRCQENGRCASGACVGTPRSCDDDNPCTVDSCSPTEGCVTSPVACPAPTRPCRVGLCDRDEGCTEVDAADFTPCGSFDCKESNVCFQGSCIKAPTPEGTVCAPATACQGEGTCQKGECERPDAGDLEYVFRQELGGEPVAEDGGPVLLVQDGALFASVCGGDAGCRLVSFTSGGLLRFESPYPDGGARTLLAASDAGVVVLATEGLEGYAPRGDGARLWEAPYATMPPPPDSFADAGAWRGATGAGRVALTGEGDVWAYVDWWPSETGNDGGTVSLPGPLAARVVRLAGLGDDAGTRAFAGALETRGAAEPLGEGRLGLDVAGTVVSYRTDGWLAFLDAPDGGGTRMWSADLSDGGVSPFGSASLAVAGGRALVGAWAFVPMDGGSQARVDWDGGARTLVPLAEPALLPPEGAPGYLFARACGLADGGTCTPEEERVVLRAVDVETGRVRWEVDALPSQALPGTLHDATLVRGGAVGVLATAAQPDGPRVWFQLFAGGERLGMCPLPGHPRLAGAAFVDGRLHVVVERDGAWLLESYGVDGQAETGGWPQRHGGASGARRESPP